MKPKIHPEYANTTITCACGAVYHVGSTKKNIKVDICARCHPFFTGVRKIVDTTGRVERFMRKYGYIAETAGTAQEALAPDAGAAPGTEATAEPAAPGITEVGARGPGTGPQRKPKSTRKKSSEKPASQE